MNEENGKNENQELFSMPVKTGKRTYFFDVKSTRAGVLFLTITESKKKMDHEGKFFYEKHKIYLYREDFEKFLNAFQESTRFIQENSPVADLSNNSGESGDVKFEDI